MTKGGGKYDAALQAVLELIEAEAVVLIVRGGNNGDGFSIGVDQRRVSPAQVIAELPHALRDVANTIEVEIVALIREGKAQH